MVDNFVLTEREPFHDDKKFVSLLAWSTKCYKAINDYVYAVEDLQNGLTDEVHVSKLKFYLDYSLDKKAIMSHVLSPKTGMVIKRLLCLEDAGDGMCVVVRWKRLPKSENTTEPYAIIWKAVPELFKNSLQHKNTTAALDDKAKKNYWISKFKKCDISTLHRLRLYGRGV